MSVYSVASSAAQDLDDIWEYIARDSLRAADDWLQQLLAAFEALAKQPGMGHRRSDLTPLPILFWPVGRYLVLYKQVQGGVTIVAVTEGSRNIPILLSQRLG